MKFIRIISLSILFCMMLFIIPLNAQNIVPLSDYNYEYVVKVVCGEQKNSKNLSLARGLYATTINIHNPNDTIAVFYKKLALTYPPGKQQPGKIIPLGVDKLEYDEALQTDGNDIRTHYNFSDYFEGFVVIQSRVNLDVSAVYTTSAKTAGFWRRGYQVISMDVENIKGRKIKCHPPDTDTAKLDHFLIYRIDTVGFKADVGLETMFDTGPKDAKVVALEYFANPAKKWHDGSLTDISYPDGHFTIYGFNWWQEKHQKIEFENQFGSYGVELGDTTMLMVPAQKSGHDFPKALDHYKCYQVENIFKQPDSAVVVTVDDQFNLPQRVVVQSPLYVCVPVKKTLPDGSTYVPANKDNFLVIYHIKEQSIERGIKIKDQFMQTGLHVIERVMLAVPGRELRWEK